MRIFPKFLIPFCCLFLLTGCSDTLTDIKEAASGINNAADKAASAISQDVHSLRAIEITYNEQTFTINDLYKTILRDVQWHYEKNGETNLLRVTGTWQPTLFESFSLNVEQYENLSEIGEVEFLLHFNDNEMIEQSTSAKVKYEGNEIFSNKGQELVTYVYEYYTNR